MARRTSDTRTDGSLLLRLRSGGNAADWDEFVELYRPFLLRLLGQIGLQESDALDVCQEVLHATSRDLQKWVDDGRNRSFRRWLSQVARHRAWKFIAAQRRAATGVGGTSALLQLRSVSDRHAERWEQTFEREYRDHLFAWAARRVKGEFQPHTWQAFWMTCVHQRDFREVAQELQISIGALYVARSRVASRLRQEIVEVLGDEWGRDPKSSGETS